MTMVESGAEYCSSGHIMYMVLLHAATKSNNPGKITLLSGSHRYKYVLVRLPPPPPPGCPAAVWFDYMFFFDRPVSSPLLMAKSLALLVPVTSAPTGLAVPIRMPPPLPLPSFGDSKLKLLAVLPRRFWEFRALLALTVGEGILESRCWRTGVSATPSKVTLFGELDGGVWEAI